MDLLEGLQTRRSIRTYTDQPITREQLREIIRLGTMAPSGRNNQPWRFVTIQNKETLQKLAQFTSYSHIIGKAPACFAVFVDKTAMYHEQRALERVGYTREGLLRKRAWAEGRWHDRIAYAILDEDYFAARGARG